MYEKMLIQSIYNLESLKQEKAFLIGNIFYFYTYLPDTKSEFEVIEAACNEIVNYLSEVLVSVDYEWEIMNAINRYLYSLYNDCHSFEGFEQSPEFPLFKGIFEILLGTYVKRVKEYMWYMGIYRNYIDTNHISEGYKIISKHDPLSQEKYAKLLKTIPRV